MSEVVSSETLDRMEQRVADVESVTTAEVVIVIARQSGSYRDLSIIGGVAVGLVALLMLLYLPISFPAPTVLPLTLVAGLLGVLLFHRTPSLLRLMTTQERRLAQVRDRARVAFVDEAVSATRERTGLLVFVSLFERSIELMTDHGLDGRISGGTWNELVLRARQAAATQGWEQALDELLEQSKTVLGEHFPATEDNLNEIPNRPRVLS